MKIFVWLTMFVALAGSKEAISLISFDTEPRSTTEESPILDPELSTFAHLMVEAGIRDLFKGTGPFTGFIPTNEAFNKLGQGKIKELTKPENQDRLVEILMYHIVPGKYLARNLKTEKLKTINGKYLNIEVQNNEIKVDDAKIVKMDVIGPNGAIQEIDTVLFP